MRDRSLTDEVLFLELGEAGFMEALREPRASGILVATRSFTCEYDGEETEVIAGRTRVAPEHELAQLHPDAFEPEADSPPSLQEDEELPAQELARLRAFAHTVRVREPFRRELVRKLDRSRVVHRRTASARCRPTRSSRRVARRRAGTRRARAPGREPSPEPDEHQHVAAASLRGAA